MTDDEKIEVVRADRRKVLFPLVAALALVGAGINLVARGGTVAAAIGIVGLVFFGFCVLMFVAFLVRPPIVVLFGSRGVAVPGGLRRRSAPSIPWAAISALRIYRYQAAPLGSGIRMLGLVPVDLKDAIWRERWSRRANRKLTGLPVSISGQLIPGELEELVERFRHYKADLPFEYGETRAAGLGWLGSPRRRRDHQ